MFSFWRSQEFPIEFKAFLCEDKSRKAFGLRIVGSKVVDVNGKKDTGPGNVTEGTYVQVGGCKPRKLKSGTVTIQ